MLNFGFLEKRKEYVRRLLCMIFQKKKNASHVKFY